MLPDGPTTTTVAPPVGLAAFEYAMHASASFLAVSTLTSCRCARLVASADIVTCASVAGEGAWAHACAATNAAASATDETLVAVMFSDRPAWACSPRLPLQLRRHDRRQLRLPHRARRHPLDRSNAG